MASLGPTDGGEPLLSVRALSFRFTERVLFERLSFDISPGLTLVTGGSGAGKTTLLELMANVRAPTGGEVSGPSSPVHWEGHFRAVADTSTVREWFGYVQARFPDWNAGLEVALCAAFGLDSHRDKALYMLSRGSRRKLQVVSAFACQAPVALLDTPFAALDAASRGLLGELLAEAAEHPRRAWVISGFECPAVLSNVVFSDVIDLAG